MSVSSATAAPAERHGSAYSAARALKNFMRPAGLDRSAVGGRDESSQL
jgi:hypothetical protein